MADEQRVILFVKLPERGKVKSRLSRDMDWDFVLHLYDCMVQDMITMLKRSGVPFLICYDPPGALEQMERWLGREYSYSPQTGNDLGERMEHAFARTFQEGIERVLLVGSDIPGLSRAVIAEAFESLAAQDAVIGPARDGGYYLIGFQKNGFDASIFRDMIWSTDAVYGETVMRLRGKNRKVHVLQQCTDVDTKEDLKTLLRQMEEQGTPESRTLLFLRTQRNRIIG